MSLETKGTLSDFHYEFSLSEAKQEVGKNSLLFCNVSIGFGKVVDGKVQLSNEENDPLFTQINPF